MAKEIRKVEIEKLRFIGKLISKEMADYEESLEYLNRIRLMDKRNIELYKYMTTPIEDITILPEIDMNTDLDEQIKSLRNKVKILNENYCIIQDRIEDLKYEWQTHTLSVDGKNHMWKSRVTSINESRG
jgi:hypothetical protein